MVNDIADLSFPWKPSKLHMTDVTPRFFSANNVFGELLGDCSKVNFMVLP